MGGARWAHSTNGERRRGRGQRRESPLSFVPCSTRSLATKSCGAPLLLVVAAPPNVNEPKSKNFLRFALPFFDRESDFRMNTRRSGGTSSIQTLEIPRPSIIPGIKRRTTWKRQCAVARKWLGKKSIRKRTNKRQESGVVAMAKRERVGTAVFH